MVTASPTKNVRPAKGGFRPKARFGLKPKEAPKTAPVETEFTTR